MNGAGARIARVTVVLGLFVAVVVLVIGCRHGATIGQPCRERGRASCVDASHAVVCRGYSWHLDTCRGPRACSGAGGRAECDQRVAAEGDPCGERSKTSCTENGQGMLECNGSTTVLVSSCRGPDGCRPGAVGALCDTSAALAGDRCMARRGNAATAYLPPLVQGVTLPREVATCSAERDAELTCIDGVYNVRWSCRGPKGCRASETEVFCDRSVAQEGDRCDSQQDACGADGRSVLRCNVPCGSGRYVVAATCKGPGGCATGAESPSPSCVGKP